MKKPIVSIIMGSQSDWQTMQKTAEILDEFAIPYETLIVSAHRTPQRLYKYASDIAELGVKIVIAGAGGVAHLPGMVAAITHLPVLGVPIKSSSLQGVDSLLSIVQMPFGVPVATLAIGEAGAKNAAILAATILAVSDNDIALKLKHFRKAQTDSVLLSPKGAPL